MIVAIKIGACVNLSNTEIDSEYSAEFGVNLIFFHW